MVVYKDLKRICEFLSDEGNQEIIKKEWVKIDEKFT